jgi:glycine cleavage system transcriptional repressor
MQSHAILTAIGTDRPGLVDEVSQYIFDRGGNIEDSRMVNLRGQFAMMVLVAGSSDVLARVQNDLVSLGGLHAEMRPAAAGERAGGAGAQALPYRLRGTGIDQAGMVHRVAHVLREMNVTLRASTRSFALPRSPARRCSRWSWCCRSRSRRR